MNDFSLEFGFLPPELVFKTHEFIRAYHKTRGSGWLFVKKVHIRAARSRYLSDLERRIVAEGRIFWVALGCIFLFAATGFFLSIWLVAFSAIAALVSFFLARRIEFDLIQERTLIIAMEVLSIDFAGWGTLFPFAKQEAEQWLDSIGFDTQTKLLDAYMPPHRRVDFIDAFRPSQESIARARSDMMAAM